MIRQEEGFIAAVEAIYAAASAPKQWPAALEAIAACFDDQGALLLFQRDDGSLGTIVAPGLEAAQRDYEERGWWRHDIRFSRSVERAYIGRSDAITDWHIASQDEIEAHPFYAQFLASHGLRWFAGIGISPHPHIAAVLSIQRIKSKPPFSDDDLSLLAQIGRHVENALRLGVRLIDGELANLTLSEALARLNVGVFLIDGSMRILSANPLGQQLVGDAFLIVNERLTARFAAEQAALQAAITAALTKPNTSHSPKPVLIHGLDLESFHAVYVLPAKLPSETSADYMLAGIRAAVVAVGSKAGEVPDPALVRDLLGLTLSEARVAALVGSGVPPKETSKRLGISEETTRTTLKHVFGKIGISRQSELAALLTRLVLK